MPIVTTYAHIGNIDCFPAAPLVYEKSLSICSAINVPKRMQVASIRNDVGKNKVPNYKQVPHLGFMIAIRFMSNPYLPVEKVTESLRKTITLVLSFGLAANDKRREEICRHQQVSSRIPS